MNEFKKTPTSKRKNYSYNFVNGEHFIPDSNSINNPYEKDEQLKKAQWEKVHPDEDYCTYWIKYLHRADDRIVQNNLDNSHLPVKDEVKEAKTKWDEEHPGEAFTGHWHLRFDSIPSNDSDTGIDADKSMLLKDVSSSTHEDDESNDLIIRVQELLHSFNDDYIRIFQLIYEEGYNNSEVAKIMECSEGNIRKKLQKIQKMVAEDLTIRKLIRA